MSAFQDAAVAGVGRLGAAALLALADRVADGWPDAAVVSGAPGQGIEVVRDIVESIRAESVPRAEAAAFLRGVAASHARQTAQISADVVWSGPGSHAVPVRATAQALIEVIDEATRELVVMTYSARPHEGITAALTAAVDRGVAVSAIVETLQGAGSLLSGAEPAAAFADVPRVELWHWPASQRTESGARMHAKLAVADRRVLLVSSANLTMSGVSHNIEAGVLVRGGAAPVRAADHIAALKATGVLRPLRTNG